MTYVSNASEVRKAIWEMSLASGAPQYLEKRASGFFYIDPDADQADPRASDFVFTSEGGQLGPFATEAQARDAALAQWERLDPTSYAEAEQAAREVLAEDAD